MTSTGSTFSKSDKFNGTNWASWQRLICTMAMSKGACDYLDKSIKQSPSLSADKASPAGTPWLRNFFSQGIESMQYLDFGPTFDQHKEPSWIRN